MRPESSVRQLQARIRADQRRIASGERPVYHASWKATLDGASDVTIVELPIIHLFVPDRVRLADGARGLIARTLAVDAAAFDVMLEEPAGSR